MPVETRSMENELITVVDENNGLFNDSALASFEHCLTGTSFILAGVSSHLSTKELEWLIMHCGGTIVTYVTEDTDFLIKGSEVGDKMHGVSKVEELQVYLDAVHKGTIIMTTLEFFQMLGRINPDTSIKSLEEGWHKDFKLSLRETSAYGLSERGMHRYTLEFAKSNRSRCHGHCKKLIPEGHLRLKACFDPLSDSFVYFRCLKCITPTILSHIESDWYDSKDGLLNFALNQPDDVLSCFEKSANFPENQVLHSLEDKVCSPEVRGVCARNLVVYLRNVATMEAQRRHDETLAEEKQAETLGKIIPVHKDGQLLGKRRRHKEFESKEMHDFMEGLPPSVVAMGNEKQLHAMRETRDISPSAPAILAL